MGLGELADILGVQSWRVARLFESGILPEVPRIRNRPMTPKGMIPEIVGELRRRGWLSHTETRGHEVDVR
jgi:hypothetical protein